MASSSGRGSEGVAVVIIPAAYSVHSQYETVASYCRSLNTDVVVVQHPSTGGPSRDGHVPSMYHDAANARRHVEAFMRSGKDVMVVGHAYGAVVASQACQGLGKEEILAAGGGAVAETRAGATGRGGAGVVRLVFVAGIVGMEGQSVLDSMGGMSGLGAPDGIADGYCWYTQERFAASFYSSASSPVCAREVSRHAERHRAQSAQTFTDPLTAAAYRYIPVTYMILDDDAVIPRALQEQYVRLIEVSSGQAVDALHYPTDHFPWVTRPEAVIDCLRRAAGDEYFEGCNWT